ncbi:MAG: EAL domain-containing protein [Gammaproteobacteria bacterium]|nr:EAL domain-containing protein [Gammaproteobacteria bacterium]
MSDTNSSQSAGQALVVSDDKALSRQLARLLQSEGYDTEACTSPTSLHSIVEEHSPAVVIVDAGLAPDDPLELCDAVRRLPGCDYIPLILVTESCDSTTEERAYARNVTTVVTRPVNEESFRKSIRSLGDTGRTLSGIRALRTPATQILRTMPDAFFIVGGDGLFRQYLGGANDDPVLRPEEIEGQNIADVWPAGVAKQVQQSIKRVLRSREGDAFEVQLTGDDVGHLYELRLLVQGRDKVLVVIRNLQETSGTSSGAGGRDLADTVTGLAARDSFERQFDAIIADAKLRERGVAVFCIDIDRFGRINDTLGRAVGDAVLKVTARRIESCLRSSDKLARMNDDDKSTLTRLSGDEFVLVLADIESRDDISTVANRVQEAFAEPVSVEGHQLKVTPSVGIAIYPLDGSGIEELIKNARVALDEAKVMSVEGREFFSSTMKYRSLKRLDVKNELRWAIEKEQLELHYLPRIDLNTGRVAGLEALLRWMHPLRGSVPLSEVLPLAEATGLIFPIGEWVVRTACEQAAAWYREDNEAPVVSINLSQQEFTRNDLVDLISQAVTDSGLPPSQLEVELTEGMLMRNRQSHAMLQALSALGVGVVLDDFGQGHSSIANLTSLPIKAIKIDRAFIDGVMEPGEKQSICSAMIAMARELGILVVAEGVESELQVEFLRERGCNAVQGFLYTEPLPVERVRAFLNACEQVLDETAVIDLHTIRQQISVKTAS